MWISEINLINFRNYEQEKINLENNINVFYGKNAQGKTNIIESIFLTSLGKSYRAKKDIELIRFNQDYCKIEILYHKKDRDGKIKIEIKNKKNIYLNGIKIKKLSELLGNINIVIFTPEDINILKGGPQERRKFLDIMISQLRPNYMYILNLYNKTLEERNAYLKQIKLEHKDIKFLEIWDQKLAEYGQKIFNYRNEFINKIKNKIIKIHQEITNNSEEIEIIYNSDCENKNKFLNILEEKKKIDIIKGYTTKGIHRDDFSVLINGKEVNIYGSQGQNRTAMLSLKLSELNVVYDEIGEYPILLLDDFMSELDENRRRNFLENIHETQVIITCTEKISIANSKYLIYNVNGGKTKRENNN